MVLTVDRPTPRNACPGIPRRTPAVPVPTAVLPATLTAHCPPARPFPAVLLSGRGTSGPTAGRPKWALFGLRPEAYF